MPVWLSVYVWACFLFVYPPTIFVALWNKLSHPSMSCKYCFVNVFVWKWRANAWMGDKQCEIMMRFEDVFGCGSPMRETGENKSLYLCLCALVWGGRGGNIAKRAQMCWWIGAHVTAFSSACSYIPQPLCIWAAVIWRMFSPTAPALSVTSPAAFNTCSSHRENTPLSLEDDEGVGSAASWLITILLVN